MAAVGVNCSSRHAFWICCRLYAREVHTLQDPDCGPGPNIEADAHEALRRDLVRAVRKVCPRSLAEDAEDLVQESFIRLLRARKLDGASNLSATYLKKVAYSAVIDEIRRRRRQVAAVAGADIDIEAAPDETRSTIPDTALGKAMEVCMQRLQDYRRQALTLHLLGYSGPEVARMLECNSKRAENLTLRGLAQLRECLHGMGLSP
jgi:RNA polymerase sigma factor (sigma-70 family)